MAFLAPFRATAPFSGTNCAVATVRKRRPETRPIHGGAGLTVLVRPERIVMTISLNHGDQVVPPFVAHRLFFDDPK